MKEMLVCLLTRLTVLLDKNPSLTITMPCVGYRVDYADRTPTSICACNNNAYEGTICAGYRSRQKKTNSWFNDGRLLIHGRPVSI
jgi:hypothetical protein